MDQSLTSSEKSARNFLEARDKRQDVLAQILSEGCRPGMAHAPEIAWRATLFLSLNIPGFEKMPPGAETLFNVTLDLLSETFARLVLLSKAVDLLGPYAIMALEMDPVEVKRCCIAIETQSFAARLIDLDVYSEKGIQIDRSGLGFPPRRCLVCQCPAVDCIRLKQHSPHEVIAKTHELLAHFSA